MTGDDDTEEEVNSLSAMVPIEVEGTSNIHIFFVFYFI